MKSHAHLAVAQPLTYRRTAAYRCTTVGNSVGVGQYSRKHGASQRLSSHSLWIGSFSRAHTWRLMFDADYAANSFPRCRKLGKHRNSHPVWRVSDILAYFEA